MLRIQVSSMEVTVSRSIMKSTNYHFLNPILLSKLKLFPIQSQLHFPRATLSLSNPNSHPRIHFPNLNPSLFNKPSIHQFNLNTPLSIGHFARISSGHSDKPFEWKFSLDDVNNRELLFVGKEERPVVTVVVLGWLGSKQKHLRRYAEMYNQLGMNAVTFATPVNDALGFDLGKKIEARIAVLSDELVAWLKGNEKENDGRERLLMFHTFSNTGWLVYGYILNILQGREELLKKIKGCVVDSGGDPELDPKVWAAGFSTAMLKKQSSAVYSFSEYEPFFIEVFLLTVFEKFFTYLLELPDIKKRLTRVTSTLSENQSFHPQLYLYSSADKVIPFQKIESFAEHQKKLGRKVTTFNFKSTPHVDHYRTFPDTYQSLIQDFLKDCFATKGKQMYNLGR